MPNVHLTGPMTRYAQAQVESGAYANLSEVVRAGMRLLMERDGACNLAELRAAIQQGLDDVAGGGIVDIDPVTFEPDAFGPEIMALAEAEEAKARAGRRGVAAE